MIKLFTVLLTFYIFYSYFVNIFIDLLTFNVIISLNFNKKWGIYEENNFNNKYVNDNKY